MMTDTECYACMVGVWTGPESHSPGCSARDARPSDGLFTNPTDHRVYTEYEGDRAYWQCSCGASGSCAAEDADLRSDKHIDYTAGEGRVDTSRNPDW